MLQVTIYTDGACSGNPGAGGWGAILQCGNFEKRISGGEPQTTNNRMELTAVIQALKCMLKPSKISIHTDSAYIVNAISQGWLRDWQRNFWRTSSNKPVQNQDLWLELVKFMETHEVTFIKVKGHADNELNNECDRMARAAIRGLKNS